MVASLAERLRSATREAHARAERAGAMAKLLRGQLPLTAYCALLRNLHALYESLESAMARHRDDAAVRHVHFPALLRADAIAWDLRALHGEAWREDLALADATRRYVGRLEEVAASEPALLAAHAYVRYLGDLNGGQVLKDRVAASTGITGDAGLHFYDFGAAKDVESRIAEFRIGLDALGGDPGRADRIVDEAILAFELHIALFEELDDGPARP